MSSTQTTPGGKPIPREGARRHAHPGLVLAVIAGAQLMVVLDATIVNVALPTMGEYFGKNQVDMTWAVNAYALAFGGLLLLGGRMGDILGRRQMFILGLALFSAGSLLGGLATADQFWFLLLGRVIQGIGGAIAAPTALSLITVEFEEGAARNKAMGVYAAVSGAGAALGLLFGGMLTTWASWRWVLFVNVPIGLLLIAGAYTYLHDTERLKGKFDFVGAALSVAGMTTLVYAFIHVAHDGWSDGMSITLFIVSIALLVGFVAYEIYGTDSPMMPMRIFDNRSRTGGYLVMLVTGAAMFGLFLYLTFFIQGVLEYSALKTGVAYLPFPLTVGITSGIAAGLLPKVGPRPLITAGTVILAVSMLWLSTIDKDAQYWPDLVPPMILQALSMGLLFVPLTIVAVTRVADTDAGLASALLNVGQQVGGALGVSILATVFATGTRNEAEAQFGALADKPETAQNLGVLLEAAQGNPVPEAAVHSAAADAVALDASHAILAAGSGAAFLTAAFLAIGAAIVAGIVINVRKEDMPSNPMEAAMHAAA